MREVDKWALSRLNWLVDRMTRAFDEWDWHLFYHDVHGFCAVDLSSFYLDVLKDTLYTDLPNSAARRSAQTALWETLVALTKIMAPVLTYTADEIWRFCRAMDDTLPVSVQIADWPTVNAGWQNEGLSARWEGILAVRDEVTAALERAKNDGAIERPLDARVEIVCDAPTAAMLRPLAGDLAGLFVVSKVVLTDQMQAGAQVTVSRAEGEKCPRCWMTQETVGAVAEHPTLCERCATRVMQWNS